MPVNHPKQVFPNGTRVEVIGHGPGYTGYRGKQATVASTYAQSYGATEDRDYNNYTLDIDGQGKVSWFDAGELREVKSDVTYRVALESYNPDTNEIIGTVVTKEYTSMPAAKLAYGEIAQAFEGCNVDCILESKTNDPYDIWNPVD